MYPLEESDSSSMLSTGTGTLLSLPGVRPVVSTERRLKGKTLSTRKVTAITRTVPFFGFEVTVAVTEKELHSTLLGSI